jgi:hypothetical protein
VGILWSFWQEKIFKIFSEKPKVSLKLAVIGSDPDKASCFGCVCATNF